MAIEANTHRKNNIRINGNKEISEENMSIDFCKITLLLRIIRKLSISIELLNEIRNRHKIISHSTKLTYFKICQKF